MSLSRPWHLTIRTAACLCACGLLAASVAAQSGPATRPGVDEGYPTPSMAPVSWQVDLTYRTPRRIVVESNGTQRAYWYMIYSVTNNNDSELFFIPDIEMLTQDGRVLRANNNIPSTVFEAIQKRARGVELTRSQAMVGNLLIGEDQVRNSVAIWEEPMAEMGTFDIFFGGLSGEIVVLRTPSGEVLKDSEGNPIRVRKTRQLTFKIRGDDYRQDIDQVNLLRDTWVMR